LSDGTRSGSLCNVIISMFLRCDRLTDQIVLPLLAVELMNWRTRSWDGSETPEPVPQRTVEELMIRTTGASKD